MSGVTPEREPRDSDSVMILMKFYRVHLDAVLLPIRDLDTMPGDWKKRFLRCLTELSEAKDRAAAKVI